MYRDTHRLIVLVTTGIGKSLSPLDRFVDSEFK